MLHRKNNCFCFQRKCLFTGVFSPTGALLWAQVSSALWLSRFAFPFLTVTRGGVRVHSTPVNSFTNASTGVRSVLPYMATLQSEQRTCVRKGTVESHLLRLTPAVLETIFIIGMCFLMEPVVSVSECWPANTLPRWISSQNVHVGVCEVVRQPYVKLGSK